LKKCQKTSTPIERESAYLSVLVPSEREGRERERSRKRERPREREREEEFERTERAIRRGTYLKIVDQVNHGQQ
jgi:hypothetical protein